ncbi:MAG: Gfo/Idh/MocA family oxidoreductase, partial [Clostridia bacterium]|nr:Gfo/Idh/MocA family oxidoreductase [Clostridia bacterium]
MSDKLKIVFIGAGSRANQVHYPAFSELSDVEMAGICDVDPVRLHQTADRYGLPHGRRFGESGIYAYRDMIEAVHPDAVVCIGNPHTAYDIWMWCLERGLPLYVEKPLGLNLHQARMLTEMARRNGCVTTCALQRRTTPSVMRLREECLKRGSITHAVVRFYKYDMNDRFDARDHLYDDTVHAIDALRWACGDSELAGLESVTRSVGVHDINFISATLRFQNDALGYLINSWSSGRRVFSIEMHAPGVCAEAEHE